MQQNDQRILQLAFHFPVNCICHLYCLPMRHAHGWLNCSTSMWALYRKVLIQAKQLLRPTRNNHSRMRGWPAFYLFAHCRCRPIKTATSTILHPWALHGKTEIQNWKKHKDKTGYDRTLHFIELGKRHHSKLKPHCRRTQWSNYRLKIKDFKKPCLLLQWDRVTRGISQTTSFRKLHFLQSSNCRFGKSRP